MRDIQPENIVHKLEYSMFLAGVTWCDKCKAHFYTNTDTHTKGVYEYDEFQEGDIFKISENDYIKIMAIRDGWIMARRKGAMPFVEPEKDFIGKVNYLLNN